MLHLRGCRADFDAWRDLAKSRLGLRRSGIAIGRNRRRNKIRRPPTGSPRCSWKLAGSAAYLAIRRSKVLAKEGAGLYPVARVNGQRWDAAPEFLRPR